MSGHSSFQSNNAVIKWIEYRLPIFSFVNEALVVYPTPKNLNYWWNFGSLAGIVLVIMIATGIWLAMHYTPHVDYAFGSVERIKLVPPFFDIVEQVVIDDRHLGQVRQDQRR